MMAISKRIFVNANVCILNKFDWISPKFVSQGEIDHKSTLVGMLLLHRLMAVNSTDAYIFGLDVLSLI